MAFYENGYYPAINGNFAYRGKELPSTDSRKHFTAKPTPICTLAEARSAIALVKKLSCNDNIEVIEDRILPRLIKEGIGRRDD